MFACEPENEYEQNRIGAVQILKDENGLYHIWYNGRRDGDEFIGYATGTIADM